MFSFAVGDRCIVILTSGNLSTSQHVFKTIQKDVDAKNPPISLNTCNNFDEIADYIGNISQKKSQGASALHL